MILYTSHSSIKETEWKAISSSAVRD